MEINVGEPSSPLRIAVVLLIGVGTMGYGAYSYVEQTSALDGAEQVEATIVETGVETVEQRRGTAYAPTATFNYTFDGESYTSSNVYPGPLPRESSSKQAARDVLADYERGGTVTAYVPTGSPGDAYLQRQSSDKPLFVIGFGVLFVLGGAVSAFRR
jgi:hypothetical protein